MSGNPVQVMLERICGGVVIGYKVYTEAGNESLNVYSVDVVLILICWGRWVWLEFDLGSSGKRTRLQALKRYFGVQRVSHDFIPDERMCLVRPWWVTAIGIMCLEEGCRGEGPSLDESLENEEHLDVDSCDSDSPKNVNNDSVSPSSRVLREEDVRGVESDLVDSFEEGEIRDDSVLYNDGCIKDCMEKNLEDDAGEILGVHSQGDCGNVTTDDNEDVTPVIAPEKDSIIAPPSTPPGNDLNIAVESGSSWIDYIGPLTSDEIDSDKRWSYRDPNGNIHGLFSLAQLRSWKDYFPSDLQI
ncbi:5-oxoprolinase-like protein [Tanacetum coccineum]